MIIDGHAHAFGEFGSTERLIPLLDRLGVDKVVLCPSATESDFEFEVPRIAYSKPSKIAFLHILSNIFYLRGQHKKMPEPDNEFVFSLVNKFPDRLLQFFWIHPRNPQLKDALESNYKKMSFAGIKLHQCVAEFSNDDPGMEIISQFAAEKNIPIFIHLYNFKEIRKFVDLAKKYPHTNYIVGHMMGFEIIARRGKNLKNVYFDISTYFIISEKRIHSAIDKFGNDKIVLGSDSPIGDRCLELNIKKINNMKLSEKQKKMILGENLAKLLGLE